MAHVKMFYIDEKTEAPYVEEPANGSVAAALITSGVEGIGDNEGVGELRCESASEVDDSAELFSNLNALLDKLGVMGMSQDMITVVVDKWLSIELASSQAKLEQLRIEAASVAFESSASQSLPSQASRSSRSVKKAVRQQVFLKRCAESVEEEGYCYLRFVKLTRRLVVKDQIGSYPDLTRLFSVNAEDVDMDAFSNLVFVREGNSLFHVREQEFGDASRVFRNTMACYPGRGSPQLRALFDVREFEDYDVLPYFAVVGATSQVASSAGFSDGDFRHVVAVRDCGISVGQQFVSRADAVVQIRPKESYSSSMVFSQFGGSMVHNVKFVYDTSVVVLMKPGQRVDYQELTIGAERFSVAIVVPPNVKFSVVGHADREVVLDVMVMDLHVKAWWHDNQLWSYDGLEHPGEIALTMADVVVIRAPDLVCGKRSDLRVAKTKMTYYRDYLWRKEIVTGEIVGNSVLAGGGDAPVKVLTDVEFVRGRARSVRFCECVEIHSAVAAVAWRADGFVAALCVGDEKLLVGASVYTYGDW